MLRKILRVASRWLRTCRYCGYSGTDWGDYDHCPNCGEIN